MKCRLLIFCLSSILSLNVIAQKKKGDEKVKDHFTVQAHYLINEAREQMEEKEFRLNGFVEGRFQSLLKEGVYGSTDEEIEGVKSNLRTLRYQSQLIQEFVKSLKWQIIEETGGTNEDGFPIGGSNRGVPTKVMISNGKAEEFKGLLDEFIDAVNAVQTSNRKVEVLTLSGANNDFFNSSNYFRKMSWEETVFKDVPVVSVLNMLTYYSLTCLEMEMSVYEGFGVDMQDPLIKLYANGKEVDRKRGMRINTISALKIVCSPQSINSDVIANDTPVIIVEGSVTLVRVNRPVGAPKKVWSTFSYERPGLKSQIVDISAFKAKAKSGDRIFVEISKMKAKDSRGRTLKFNLKDPVFINIPLHE